MKALKPSLCLCRLQNPHVNPEKGEQVVAVLYREKRDIETPQGMACPRGTHYPTAITGVFKPLS